MTNEEAYELGCKQTIQMLKASLNSLAKSALHPIQRNTIQKLRDSLDSFPTPPFSANTKVDELSKHINSYIIPKSENN